MAQGSTICTVPVPVPDGWRWTCGNRTPCLTPRSGFQLEGPELRSITYSARPAYARRKPAPKGAASNQMRQRGPLLTSSLPRGRKSKCIWSFHRLQEPLATSSCPGMWGGLPVDSIAASFSCEGRMKQRLHCRIIKYLARGQERRAELRHLCSASSGGQLWQERRRP